jgi:hypothetical protein
VCTISGEQTKELMNLSQNIRKLLRIQVLINLLIYICMVKTLPFFTLHIFVFIKHLLNYTKKKKKKKGKRKKLGWRVGVSYLEILCLRCLNIMIVKSNRGRLT